ncbi:MAG TPA: hypothetical protein VEV38_09225 [Candidatus Eremiobacteraceae bacterium]|nr:hypothetical protein [Candidatus Eremiobacteraceae bacterium]
MKTTRAACLFSLFWLAACFGGCGGGGNSGSLPAPLPSPASPRPFLPLKAGDAWTYACYLGTPAPSASTFPKSNQVIGSTVVNGTTTFEYQVQIPTSPTQSTSQIQLLANDAAGNTLIYGYMSSPGASPMPVTPTIIIAQNPGPNLTTYDYPAEGGGTVSRVFCCTTPTHQTVFGVFEVDAYYDGSHTVDQAPDGYGFAVGLGSMEEDHNFNDPDPNKRIDCLITSTPSP